MSRGRRAGLTASIGGFGFIFGPMLGTGLYGINPTFPYLFAGLVLVFGIIVLVVRLRPPVAQPVM